jgi:hypothetical protein
LFITLKENIMRVLSMLVFTFSVLAAPLAMAAEARIDFTSPADGARLDAKAPITLTYELTLVGDADHAHLYVDGREATLLRQAKGSYTLDPLAQGKHEICAKLVNKNHTPIGVERCIKITAE